MAQCLANCPSACGGLNIFIITVVATPMYILFVCGMGILRVISPGKFDTMKEYKQLYGMLKTAEISLESAIQTCLGE